MAFPDKAIVSGHRLHLHGVEKVEPVLGQRDGGLSCRVRDDEGPRHIAGRAIGRRPLKDRDLAIGHRRPLPQELHLKLGHPLDEWVLQREQSERHASRAVQVGRIGRTDLEERTGVADVRLGEAVLRQPAVLVQADVVVKTFISQMAYEGIELIVLDARQVLNDSLSPFLDAEPLDVPSLARLQELAGRHAQNARLPQTILQGQVADDLLLALLRGELEGSVAYFEEVATGLAARLAKMAQTQGSDTMPRRGRS